MITAEDEVQEHQEGSEVEAAESGEGATKASSKKPRMPHRPEDIPGRFWERTRTAFERGECDNPEFLARIFMEEDEAPKDKLIPKWRQVNGDLEIKCTCRKWLSSRLLKCPHCGRQLHKPHSKEQKPPSAKPVDEGITSLPDPPN